MMPPSLRPICLHPVKSVSRFYAQLFLELTNHRCLICIPPGNVSCARGIEAVRESILVGTALLQQHGKTASIHIIPHDPCVGAGMQISVSMYRIAVFIYSGTAPVLVYNLKLLTGCAIAFPLPPESIAARCLERCLLIYARFASHQSFVD